MKRVMEIAKERGRKMDELLQTSMFDNDQLRVELFINLKLI